MPDPLIPLAVLVGLVGGGLLIFMALAVWVTLADCVSRWRHVRWMRRAEAARAVETERPVREVQARYLASLDMEVAEFEAAVERTLRAIEAAQRVDWPSWATTCTVSQSGGGGGGGVGGIVTVIQR